MTNSIIENELPGTANLRDELLDMLTDQDLAYKLPGFNPTLGGLCEEMGHFQQTYIQSFKNLKHAWELVGTLPSPRGSVAALKDWFKKLDAELVEALNGFTEEDVQTKLIDRGQYFKPSVFIQFSIYREALLIFYAKASVYLKALERPLSDEWKVGIG